MLIIDQELLHLQEISPAVHDVKRINSIKDSYDTERQESKIPTFALTL